MKGKINLISKISFFVIAVITATLCGFISFGKRDNEFFAAQAQIRNGIDYSVADENDVIFSVEKVAVNKSDNEYDGGVPIVGDFDVDNKSDDKDKNYMKNANNEYYEFEHLPNRDKNNPNKFVVHNNEFVMLKNATSGNEFYSRELGVAEGLQEAILVSLGQYNITNKASGEVSIVDRAENQGEITNIVSFVAKLNGKSANILPPFRQFGSGGQFEDLAFIIPQREDTEGYWQFEFTYRYNEQEYSQTFEFYLVFETSYTKVDSNGIDGEYSAYPTIEDAVGTTNFVFNLGSSNNYPVLTYDYTRYKMKYTHTANGIRTNYEFDFDKNEAKMDYKIESSGQHLEDELPLNYYSGSVTDNNYIVFAFTEMGYYEFSFEYLYDGEVKNNMNLPGFKTTLEIKGFEQNILNMLTTKHNLDMLNFLILKTNLMLIKQI